MNDYKKIAAIVIRVWALGFIISAVLDLGIMAAGVLLISLEIIPRDAVSHEVLFLSSVFLMIGGLVLFFRSRSLANFIVEGLSDENDSAPPQ